MIEDPTALSDAAVDVPDEPSAETDPSTPDIEGQDPPGTSAPAATPERPDRDRRRRIGVFALVVLAVAALGGSWTLASPIGSAPDDGFHLASIWCSPTSRGACDDLGFSYAAGKTFVDIPAEVGPESYCYVYDPTKSAGCQDDIETGSTERTVANDGIYPVVFYSVMGLAVGDSPVDSALLARMLSWFLCFGLLLAGWRVLPRIRRREYLLILLVLAVPHTIFLYASTNPSGVVIAAVAAAWCAVVAISRAPDRRSMWGPGALLVVATIAAAGSRSDGGLYLFIALVSTIVLVFRPWPGRIEREALVRMGGLLAAAVAGLAVSIAILGRRLETSGGLVPQESVEVAQQNGNYWYNALEIPYFITGNLGLSGIGWLDLPMPRSVWAPTVAVFFALLFWGIRRSDRFKSLALVGVLAGLLVVPYVLLWREGATVGIEVQPRYVLPLLPVLGFTALYWRRGSSLSGLSGLQLWTIVVLMSIAHCVALHTTIRRFVSGLDVRSPNLDANNEWWWDIGLTPNVVWVAGSLAFTALAVALGRSIRTWSDTDSAGTEPGGPDDGGTSDPEASEEPVPTSAGQEYRGVPEAPYA